MSSVSKLTSMPMCLLHIIHLEYCSAYLIGYLILLHRLVSILLFY